MIKKQQKVYAFIDSQNLNLGIRDQGWELDFARFRVYLKDKYKVSKAFLFIGFIEKNRKLYDFLKKSDYHKNGSVTLSTNLKASLPRDN